MKSESLEEASEFSELSARSSRTTGAEANVEVDIEEDLKMDFSCENWSDIEYNNLEYTKQDLASLNVHDLKKKNYCRMAFFIIKALEPYIVQLTKQSILSEGSCI